MKKSIEVKGIKKLGKIEMKDTKAAACSVTFDDGQTLSCTMGFFYEAALASEDVVSTYFYF